MALSPSTPAVVLLVLVTGFGSLPAATAQLPPLILGSEDEPELWGDDTVAYHPAYPFAQDHGFIAINRSWFAVDATETRLFTHLRVVSTERLEANRPYGNIQCGLSADFEDPSGSDLESGIMHWGLSSNPRTTGVSGSAYVSFEDRPIQQIETRFEIVTGTPGYYVWSVSRATVLRYAWHLTDLRAFCYDDVGYVSPIINQDDATSKSNFSVVENRRVAAPDGALDPIERFERENATAAPSSTTPEGGGEGTPAPGLAALLVAAALGALARRRR